jgi:hypothetical protein
MNGDDVTSARFSFLADKHAERKIPSPQRFAAFMLMREVTRNNESVPCGTRADCESIA